MELELCAASIEAIDLAKKFAFDRIELCQNLEQGGLSPSAGLIAYALSKELETHVLIRPRAGGFFYSPEELDVMKRDIEFCAKLGVKGVVVGILQENFDIDGQALAHLMAEHPQLEWTFHRAFDESIDWKRSLDVLIKLGFQRVLTSGFASNVELGMQQLQTMASFASG
ncbi:MAG: hypothetical protein RLZZ301_259, partial [Bacteroidota bacterium]